MTPEQLRAADEWIRALCRNRVSPNTHGKLKNGMPFFPARILGSFLRAEINGCDTTCVLLPASGEFMLVAYHSTHEEIVGYDLRFPSLELAIAAARLMSSKPIEFV